MKVHKRKGNNNSALLVSVAESIGSTLGTLAAQANAAQKAITRSRVTHGTRREAKKLMRKSKSVARKARNKRARATPGSLRRA